MMELRIWVVENDLCLLRIWVNFLFYIFLFPFYLYFLFFFFAAKLELIDVARPRPLADFSSPPPLDHPHSHTHTDTLSRWKSIKSNQERKCLHYGNSGEMVSVLGAWTL